MTHSHQNSIPLGYFIVSKKDEQVPPVGVINMFTIGDSVHPRSPYIPCDGQRLEVAEYPDLYMWIGDTYCPQTLLVEVKPSIWEKLRRSLRLTPKVIMVREPNHDYQEGFFRLPKLNVTFPSIPDEFDDPRLWIVAESI